MVRKIHFKRHLKNRYMFGFLIVNIVDKRCLLFGNYGNFM